MGIAYGSSIVRDGLTLYLDAANPVSYSPNVFPYPLNLGSWFTSGGYQMTISSDSSLTSPAGGIPLKIVTSGASAYTGTYNGSFWNLAPAASGQTWTFSFWVKGSSAFTASCLIFEANSSGAYITYGQPYYNVTTEWTRVTGSYTMTNASTNYVQFRIDNYNNGVTMWVDGLQLEKSSSATTFNRKPNINGSKWYDLSDNRLIFNSGGTTTPWATVNGTKAFTFNGSGSWICNSGYSKVDLGGDCTIILMLYEVGHSVRKTIFEKAGTSYNSYEQEVAMTWEPGQDISWYSRYSATYDFAATPTCDTNSWNMQAIKMSNGYTATARTGYYSKNGAAWTSSYSSRSNTALLPAGEIRVGTGYAGTVDNGSISVVMCYNKMLSDSEIKQNFYALRGRHVF